MSKITGTTSCGFAYSVDQATLDNMELVDAIAEMEENPTAISRVLNLMLGKDQKRALYDTLRLDDGRVPIAEVSKALTEIFAAGGTEVKNS